MTLLKGKYGLSWHLLNFQDWIYTFYIFDLSILSTCLFLGKLVPELQQIQKYHLFIKAFILMIMNGETLLGHMFGPLTRKAVGKNQCCSHDHSHGEGCGTT